MKIDLDLAVTLLLFLVSIFSSTNISLVPESKISHSLYSYYSASFFKYLNTVKPGLYESQGTAENIRITQTFVQLRLSLFEPCKKAFGRFSVI